MANPNVFAQFAQPVRSVIDYQTDLAKADALKNQNAMQALSLQQASNVQQQRNALRDLVQSGQIDLNDAGGLQKAVTVAPDVAPALAKTIQDQKTSAALAAKDTAQAGNFTASTSKTNQETQIQAHAQVLQSLSTVNSPQDAVQWTIDGIRSGALPADGLQRNLQALQDAAADPTGQKFSQWKQAVQQGGQTVQQQLEMTAAKPTEVRLGNVVKTIDMNPRSKTFGTEVVPSQAVGVSPDTVANNQTSRANNAATIAKDYKVAGLDGQGNFAAVPGTPGASGAPVSQVQQLGDAIGKYQGAESTVLSRVPPALKGQVLAYVSQTYPDYNPSTYDARTKAARDFTSGSQGNALRSFAVAGQHLDQLGTLVDALDNGNTQIINKIGNQIGSQLGSTAPTNFDAAKDVVSKEVTKAIVAGGGGVAERAELAEQMSNAKTPAQLKGVISQYRNLMSAQHDALVQQRQAAGLPDSTLPAYSKGDVMAPGVFKITHVDGKPQ